MSGLIINPYAFTTSGGGATGTPGVSSLGTITQTGPSTFQYGWSFTLTGGDIEVVGLRCYLPLNAGGTTETLRLWQRAGGVLLGSVAVTPIADEWTDGELASPVTLTAGNEYAVTTRQTDGSSRNWYYSPKANWVTASEIAFAQTVTVNADTAPNTQSTSVVYGLADILFNVL